MRRRRHARRLRRRRLLERYHRMHEPPRRKAALLSSAGRAVCRPESEIETHLSSGHADFGRTAPMMDQERKKTCAETAVGKRNQPDSNAPNEQIAVYALRSCTALQNHSYLCACIKSRVSESLVCDVFGKFESRH